MITIVFTVEERDAILQWAGMAGVGFEFGPPDCKVQGSAAVSALKKLEATQ